MSNESVRVRPALRGPLAAAVVALPVLAGARECRTAPEGAETHQLTVLTLNLRGVNDVPCNDASNNYRVRYGRVGSVLGSIGSAPDVIALQEVSGWIWCALDHQFVRDYAALDALVSALESGTGVPYRIAYMTAIVKVDGNFHCTKDGASQSACQARSGLALLYNPRRIRNLMADTPASDAGQAYAHDAAMEPGPHLRRSLPACSPLPNSTIETRIDGPNQDDKCNGKPSGLTWAAGDEAALARLSFLERPGAAFHVYNVHLAWQAEPHAQHVADVRGMVSHLEDRFGGGRWIPPLMLGDFNNKTDENSTLVDKTVGEFTDFEARGQASADDLILAGKAESFPAAHRIMGHVTAEMPRVPDSEGGCHSPQHLWSDHCAVLTTLRIEGPR